MNPKHSQFMDIVLEDKAATIIRVYKVDKEIQLTVRKLVKKYGAATRDKAQELAPFRTGLLKSSIRDWYSQDGLSYQVFSDRTFFEAEEKEYYAWFVELGTVKMPAQPFLQPAFEEQNELFRQDLRTEIRAALKRMERM